VLEEIRPEADENENENEDEDAMEEDTRGALESLLHSSKPHGNAPRGKLSIQEVTDSASTPTQGTKRRAEDGVEDLKEVVENSKRHGKGPRGRPNIEEVAASGEYADSGGDRMV
jgi:hypothetical protein